MTTSITRAASVEMSFSEPPRRAEQQLARRLARASVSGKLADSLPRSAGFNWAYFAEYCHEQGLSGLLYSQLRTQSSVVPPAVLEEFQHDYQWNQASHVVCSSELLALSARLQREGIRFLFLRGGALAEEVYADGGLRPYGDIDLVFDPENRKRVRDLFCRNGYSPKANYPNSLVKAGVELDLHEDVLNRDRILSRCSFFSAGGAELFESARQLHIEGQSIRVPDRESGLILLALHLVKHDFAQIIWWVDIAWSIARFGDQLDWDRLERLAQRWQCLGPVRFVLRRVAADYSAPIPVKWLDHLQADHAAGFFERKLDRAFDRHIAIQGASHLLLLPSMTVRQKLRYLREVVLPGPQARLQIAEDSPKGSFVWNRIGKSCQLAKSCFKLMTG